MKVFGYTIEKEKRNCSTTETTPTYVSSWGDALTFGSVYNKYTSLNLSAVFRAVDIISDAVAMLPIQIKIEQEGCKDTVKEHNLYEVFKNTTFTKFTLIKRLIMDVLLRGNAYLYLKRGNDGSVIGLRYLQAADVQIMYDKYKDTLYYVCPTITNKKIEPINIIHLVKYSNDGVNGISILNYASRTLKNSNNTENAANDFYEGGCNLAGILTVQGQLSDKQRQDIRSSWNSAYTNGGSGIAILQGNMDYKSIQLSAKESQLLDSRLFNVQDIARFFGISPVLLGDLSHVSYSTIEAAQNEFVLHTLQPYITMIEEEFTRKLFKPSEHNFSITLDENYLLRTDKTAQAQYYQTMVNSGILCINECRRQLGLNEIEGGDKHIIPFTNINQNKIDNEGSTKDKQ